MKISGTLPKDEANGLTRIARQLVDQPHRVHAVIMLVDCKSTKVDHDTGGLEATARIRRIEAVLSVDLKFAEALLRRALERRTGAVELPFELEQDVAAAFDGIDLVTGEVFDPIDLDGLPGGGTPQPGDTAIYEDDDDESGDGA